MPTARLTACGCPTSDMVGLSGVPGITRQYCGSSCTSCVPLCVCLSRWICANTPLLLLLLPLQLRAEYVGVMARVLAGHFKTYLAALEKMVAPVAGKCRKGPQAAPNVCLSCPWARKGSGRWTRTSIADMFMLAACQHHPGWKADPSTVTFYLVCMVLLRGILTSRAEHQLYVYRLSQSLHWGPVLSCPHLSSCCRPHRCAGCVRQCEQHRQQHQQRRQWRREQHDGTVWGQGRRAQRAVGECAV